MDTPCRREAPGACDPRSAVPGDNGVMPSGGVAFGDCVDVLVPPLVSPAQTAAYLPQWFGGGVPLDGVLSCTMEVPGEAGLKEQGATVREERPLDGWRKVRVLGMMCLRSGLESYRTGIT